MAHLLTGTASSLLTSVDELHTARQTEWDAAQASADARAQLERIRAIYLAATYEAGKINGSNAETRKAQEAGALASSEAVKTAEADARTTESKHAAARIERLYREERYRALLALAGAGNEAG